MQEFQRFCRDAGTSEADAYQLTEEEIKIALDLLNYNKLLQAKIVNYWRKERKQFFRRTAAKRWMDQKRQKVGVTTPVISCINARNTNHRCTFAYCYHHYTEWLKNSGSTTAESDGSSGRPKRSRRSKFNH